MQYVLVRSVICPFGGRSGGFVPGNVQSLFFLSTGLITVFKVNHNSY